LTREKETNLDKLNKRSVNDHGLNHIVAALACLGLGLAQTVWVLDSGLGMMQSTAAGQAI